MTDTIPLDGVSIKMHLIVAAIVIGFPLLLMFLTSNYIKGSTNIVLGAILLVGLPILGSIVYATSFPSVKITEHTLTVNAGFYSHSVKLSEIERDGIKTVDLLNEPELRLRMRTNGIGLYSYNLGYFTLQNAERAFVVLKGTEAVYIPTSSGTMFLLSSEESIRILDSLKRHLVHSSK